MIQNGTKTHHLERLGCLGPEMTQNLGLLGGGAGGLPIRNYLPLEVICHSKWLWNNPQGPIPVGRGGHFIGGGEPWGPLGPRDRHPVEATSGRLESLVASREFGDGACKRVGGYARSVMNL